MPGKNTGPMARCSPGNTLASQRVRAGQTDLGVWFPVPYLYFCALFVLLVCLKLITPTVMQEGVMQGYARARLCKKFALPDAGRALLRLNVGGVAML